MKTAGVRELKAHLSGYLREVGAGETVLVTDRGQVVAELRPVRGGTRAGRARDRYQDLVERGVIRPAADPIDKSWAKITWRGAPEGTARAILDADREDK